MIECIYNSDAYPNATTLRPLVTHSTSLSPSSPSLNSLSELLLLLYICIYRRTYLTFAYLHIRLTEQQKLKSLSFQISSLRFTSTLRKWTIFLGRFRKQPPLMSDKTWVIYRMPICPLMEYSVFLHLILYHIIRAYNSHIRIHFSK